MSHANGWVSREGTLVGHFLYDGTNSVARRRIHPTLDAAWATRRDGVDEPACTCGDAPVPVTLRTDYGGGSEWDSEACLPCGVITGYRDQYQWMREEEARSRWAWGYNPVDGDPDPDP